MRLLLPNGSHLLPAQSSSFKHNTFNVRTCAQMSRIEVVMKKQSQGIQIFFAATLAATLIACTSETSTSTTSSTGSATIPSSDSSTIPTTNTLTLNITGRGSVMNLSNNINCKNSACTYSLENGIDLTLMASAEPNYAFDHWEFSCDGQTSKECLINMDKNVTLTAVFAQQSGTVSLSWLAPNAREDNSALTESDIKEYVIYYRTSQDAPYEGASSFTVSADETGAVPTELVIENLQAGKNYYFAGVTIDKNGASSKFSDEIMKTVN